jgi:hypothetical protein
VEGEISPQYSDDQEPNANIVTFLAPSFKKKSSKTLETHEGPHTLITHPLKRSFFLFSLNVTDIDPSSEQRTYNSHVWATATVTIAVLTLPFTLNPT